MTSMVMTQNRVTAIAFLHPSAIVQRVLRLFDAQWFGAQIALCLPFPGETACACGSGPGQAHKVSEGDPMIIEGWIAFPTAIADGTATGTVFLESTPEAG